MVLREKLKSINMIKWEVILTYLTRISHVKDELPTIGEIVPGPELVWIAMNGVMKPWAVFVEALVARENLSSWHRMCDDFVQKETRRGLVHGSASTSKEDVDLTTKGKKKFKKGPKKGGAKQQDGKKKDLSIVK